MGNIYYERHLQNWLADDNNAHKLIENIEHLNEGELLEFLEYNKGAVDCLKHFWPDRDRKKIILACCYAILKTYEYEEAYRISIKKAEHEDYEHKIEHDYIRKEDEDHVDASGGLDIGGGYKIKHGPDGSTTVSYHEEALAQADVHTKTHNKHVNVGVDVQAQAGEEVDGSATTSDHGAKFKTGAFLGDSATVSVNGDVKYKGINADVTDGVSFGESVGASASGDIDWGHSRLTIEAGGKLVAGIGIEGKIKLSIDTKPITKDYDDLKHDVDKVIKWL